MVEVTESIIDSELLKIENEPKEEDKNNNLNSNLNNFNDFKPYVNYFHNLAFKMAKLEVETTLIEELDNTLLKIIEKRMPKIANIATNSPELIYLSTLGLAIMTAKPLQHHQEQIKNAEFHEKKENDK